MSTAKRTAPPGQGEAVEETDRLEPPIDPEHNAKAPEPQARPASAGGAIEMPNTSLKARLAWLDEVAEDDAVSPAAFKVAYLIGTYFINKTTGNARPGADTMAAHLGLSTRRAGEHIRELVTAGHLIAIRRGRGKTNLYKLPSLERTKSSDQERARP